MFGLSFPELLIVLVVALIVLGPERLPKVARTIGKGMREIRKATGDFKEVVEGEFYKLDEEVGRLPERRADERPPIPGVVAAAGLGAEVLDTQAAPRPAAEAEPASSGSGAPAAAPRPATDVELASSGNAPTSVADK